MTKEQKLGILLGNFACMMAELTAMREENAVARDAKIQPPNPAERFRQLPKKFDLDDAADFMGE